MPPQQPHSNNQPQSPATEEGNGLALAGLILALFPPTSLLGLIFSILGLKKAKRLGGKNHGLALAGLIVSVVSMIAFVGLILPLVFISAPALQRNTRNTDRRTDVQAIRAQLNTVAQNSDGNYPTPAEFDSEVLKKLSQAFYDDYDAETSLVETSSEFKIYYVVLESADDVETNVVGKAYPGVDELHVIVGVTCGGIELNSESNLYTAGDIEFGSERTVSFLYQLEGEDRASCEDNS